MPWCWSPRQCSWSSWSLLCANSLVGWGRIGLLGDSVGIIIIIRWFLQAVESWCWSHSAQRTQSAGGAPVRTLMTCASLNLRHWDCLTRFSLVPSSPEIYSLLDLRICVAYPTLTNFQGLLLFFVVFMSCFLCFYVWLDRGWRCCCLFSLWFTSNLRHG